MILELTLFSLRHLCYWAQKQENLLPTFICDFDLFEFSVTISANFAFCMNAEKLGKRLVRKKTGKKKQTCDDYWL